MCKKYRSIVFAAFLSALASFGDVIEDDFARNPLQNGWTVLGTPGLFQWNSTNQNVSVTWDSSQPNSYFLKSLGTILCKYDDFSVGFDLKLNSIAIGTDPAKPYTFQVALGLLNRASATATNFLRGTGTDSPNVFEFDYFPDSGFGPTISPTIISSNNQFASSFNVREMETNVTFHIAMSYTASNSTLSTTMKSNGIPFGPIKNAVIAPPFTDFRVDHFAVMSYSDAGQDPQFAGSILAQGIFDNLAIVTPPPPVRDLSVGIANAPWAVTFLSRSNWMYGLERTSDFITWTRLPGSIAGNEGTVTLTDPSSRTTWRFYRVRAEKP